MQFSHQDIKYEQGEGIGLLTLDRPDKRNALSTEMCEGIRDLLAQLRHQDDLKVLIVTGSGQGFCSGSDAEKRLLARIVDGRYVPMETTRADRLAPVMLYLAPAFYEIGKPTIAAVNGVAAGAGLSLALLCDIRLASDKARFVASWTNVGLTPDVGATYLLPRIIGTDRALKMMVTAGSVDAAEAERMNMVTQVVPHDELMKRARELAETIARGPSVAIELTKRAVQRSLTSDLNTQLYFENYAQEICMNTNDFKEGVNAFREKRKPQFKGN